MCCFQYCLSESTEYITLTVTANIACTAILVYLGKVESGRDRGGGGVVWFPFLGSGTILTVNKHLWIGII